jgi:dTDP-4-dehydrorhamnose reductase
MAKVLILGGSGLIGQGVALALGAAQIPFSMTSRAGKKIEGISDTEVIKFDANEQSIEGLLSSLQSGDYVINCVGKVKSLIDDADRKSREDALNMNTIFPARLASASETIKLRMIHITTDCVYSGLGGSYLEDSPHDALDVYGKTKSLGEIPSRAVMSLRVSVIGRGSQGLHNWVTSQPRNANIVGYLDHWWNGITSAEYGRIIAGIVREDLFSAGVHHIVPDGRLSKNELVNLIALNSNRTDLKIKPENSGTRVDRTLATNNPEFNSKLWRAAGRLVPPLVSELIAEI